VVAAPGVLATAAANKAVAAIPSTASLVIGSMVQRPGVPSILTTGQSTLNFLNAHFDAMNRAINAQALLQLRARGKPIIDTFGGSSGPLTANPSSALAMERAILQAAGWKWTVECGVVVWRP
jgi:hypothetical protein